ncbi:MAG: MerR family transcriptional regulator [Flavobacteriaceae bacterium]|nr:MerR family transcriptional regulator [Flavobacteriaceae bacterium]
MSKVKNSFSIKNLENISGIKAHTLRIWEKRYNLLSPERTDTNIRRYSLDSLRKLLNITLLYNNGYKISKIAAYEESEIPQLVRQLALTSKSEQVSINKLKLAMVNFDSILFDLTFDEMLVEKGFDFIYMKVFIPLLHELGILWQTNAICLSHEHFITNLIKQKIHAQTHLAQSAIKPNEDGPCFVLFLPENEIHELSILYLNQLLLSKGYKTIFLGQSVPTNSLATLLSFSSQLHFVTFCIVEPNQDVLADFISNFEQQIIKTSDSRLSIFGPRIDDLDPEQLPDRILAFKDLEEFKHRFLEPTIVV